MLFSSFCLWFWSLPGNDNLFFFYRISFHSASIGDPTLEVELEQENKTKQVRCGLETRGTFSCEHNWESIGFECLDLKVKNKSSSILLLLADSVIVSFWESIRPLFFFWAVWICKCKCLSWQWAFCTRFQRPFLLIYELEKDCCGYNPSIS
jgi:hypothetical protein